MSMMLLLAASLYAQETTVIAIHPQDGKNVISKNIYGQFAEHLGTCIYGGLWVGENSSIPNTNGYRNDVLQALKDLKVPVLRWPGGCFADDYHWMDGIGPKENRPKLVNSNWGGTIEDNALIGFRDESFDSLVSGREQLTDYLVSVDREACLKLFGTYLEMEHNLY